jgi:hypothetical protein
MKRTVIFLAFVLTALILAGCRPAPTHTPTALPQPSPTLLAPTLTPMEEQPTPTASIEPTFTPTLSLEEQYGIPEGWTLYPAERAESYFEPELTGFAFALSDDWTCHDAIDRMGIPYECILDESEDRFENATKAKLQFSNIQVIDSPPPIEELAQLNDFKQTYGHTCMEEYLSVAGLDAVIVKCIHPGFDETLDFENDRAAYEDAIHKLPQLQMFIINGKRIEHFWMQAWQVSHLDLFDDVVPIIMYGMEDQPGINITE